MKKLLIASLILSSSAVNSNELVFTTDNLPECTMEVLKGSAEILFIKLGFVSEEYKARVQMTSNIKTRADISIKGDWTDTSAWGGKEPSTSLGFIGAGGSIDYINGKEGTWSNHLQQGTPTDFSIVTYADKNPTHVGSGKFNSVVEFSCY